MSKALASLAVFLQELSVSFGGCRTFTPLGLGLRVSEAKEKPCENRIRTLNLSDPKALSALSLNPTVRALAPVRALLNPREPSEFRVR